MLPLILLSAALMSEAPAGNLQHVLDRAMAGRAGAAVALDVDSGRILAQYHLKVAAQRLVSPGSTVKPFTLLALLHSGVPLRPLLCPRTLQIGGRSMDCTHPPSADPFDAIAALAYSCNYYFASQARLLGSRDLVETFTRAGLTAITGLYAGEAAGEIVAPSTAEARELLAIGEANILVTPLELLFAYRKLALRKDIPPEVRAGLEAATAYGTARLACPPGVKVAGKTGTSLDAATGQAHAWFAGFAPAGAPRIVLVVFLEQGVGGRDAAPIARELFQAALPAP
jgi:cell division protein FtsI/penicillin-binding protein 2